MRFWIPKLGDTFVLEKNWIFALHATGTNAVFLKAFFDEDNEGFPLYTGRRVCEIELPAGVTLEVDRIYIRQGRGQEVYNSVTFLLVDVPDYAEVRIPLSALVSSKVTHFVARKDDLLKKDKPRFWVKLEDANKIEYVA